MWFAKVLLYTGVPTAVHKHLYVCLLSCEHAILRNSMKAQCKSIKDMTGPENTTWPESILQIWCYMHTVLLVRNKSRLHTVGRIRMNINTANEGGAKTRTKI